MKNRTLRRERGGALLATLAFATFTALLIGAGLSVSSGHYSLAWSQGRSEGALLLAEGGMNDELAAIAANVGVPSATALGSSPTVAAGETLRFPGENHAVWGRRGTISGTPGSYWVCATNNEWWRSGDAPVAWDGRTSPFWITSTAYVNGAWRRVEGQVSTTSLFALYAVYAMASYSNNSNAVVLSAGDVIINGVAGTNGQISNSNGSTFQAAGLINAYTLNNPTGQFDSRHAMPGASFLTQAGPFIYPTTVSVLRRTLGIPTYSDAAAWSYLANNNDNDAKVYTYRGGASSATLSAANCTRLALPSTDFTNGKSSAWASAGAKPGTSGKVKTLIFEPGDYYFTSVALGYDAATELVIDPQALASGGTPGQVRFWIYDPAGKSNDAMALPIVATKPAGASTADPGGFRIYYGKDGKAFEFSRPGNTKDWNGASLLGDFNVYGGVYAVTKQPGDTSSVLAGTEIDFVGSTGAGDGRITLNGSLLADKVHFHGPCTVNFMASTVPGDPPAGVRISGGYDDGG